MNSIETLIDLLENNLVIPEIQRDYVWGNNETVVKRFLNNIKNNNKLDTGFFYSYKIYDDSYALIDGQQRITTLILLYWYLNIEKEKLQKFKFKVRENCNNFLTQLLKSNKNDIENSIQNSKLNFSEKIKNSSWYLSIWNDDPTIKSMLKSLDIINKFIKENNENNIKKNINNITFTCITHDNRDIEIEYILLNSRGVPLTLEEQLKPILIEDIIDIERKNKWLEKWDKDWQDILWECQYDNIYDTKYIWNAVLYWVRDIFVMEKTIYKTSEDTEKDLNNLDFEYDLISISGNNNKKYVLDILDWVIPALNYINKNIEDIKKAYETEKYNYLEWILKGETDGEYGLDYSDKVMIYSVLYLFKEKNEKNISELDLEKIRIFRNLVLNTDIDSPKDIYNALSSLKKLSKANSIGELKEILSKSKSKSKSLTAINNEQRKEELLKLQIFEKYSDYKNIILDMEKSELFNGKIKNIFILMLSNSTDDIIKLYNKNTIFTDDNIEHLLNYLKDNDSNILKNLFSRYKEIDEQKINIWGELLLEDNIYKNDNNDILIEIDEICGSLVLNYLYNEKKYKDINDFLFKRRKNKLKEINKYVDDIKYIENPIHQLYITYVLSYDNGHFIFYEIKKDNKKFRVYGNDSEIPENDKNRIDKSPFNKKLLFQSYRYQWRGGQPYVSFDNAKTIKKLKNTYNI
ncbi:DUF262 domain-containing protein [Brachyspira pilosicoli]|uniref:DUF262 domain-containing protein n=1 Tax=Brachyspira pilosicoli TaxID=52584 RepID=UPI003006508E